MCRSEKCNLIVGMYCTYRMHPCTYSDEVRGEEEEEEGEATTTTAAVASSAAAAAAASHLSASSLEEHLRRKRGTSHMIFITNFLF